MQLTPNRTPIATIPSSHHPITHPTRRSPKPYSPKPYPPLRHPPSPIAPLHRNPPPKIRTQAGKQSKPCACSRGRRHALGGQQARGRARYRYHAGIDITTGCPSPARHWLLCSARCGAAGHLATWVLRVVVVVVGMGGGWEGYRVSLQYCIKYHYRTCYRFKPARFGQGDAMLGDGGLLGLMWHVMDCAGL